MRRRLLAVATAFALAWLTASTARAEVTLRPMASGMVLFLNDKVTGGGCGHVSLGYNFEMEPLLLIPEMAGGIGGYGAADGLYARVQGGFRGGFAGPVEPTLFFRVGWGTTTIQRGDVIMPESGVAIDAGLAVDYRMERWLTVGGEVFYDLLVVDPDFDNNKFHAIGLGATATFWL